MGAVGLFAIFHGHAHGSEVPLDASGFEYGIGFMLATAVLHAVGIGIGFLIGMSSERVGKSVYRVRVGNYGTADEAQRVSARLTQQENLKPWITR